MSKKRNRRFVVDLYDVLQLREQYAIPNEALDALTLKAYFAYPAPDLIDHISMILQHPVRYIRYRVRRWAETRRT